ncbi:dihydrofolate reductase [Candidatus Purcelliella pentastirinorum]|uniref:Dihydrofolate reductase n=1 Tax=Candidatus Purcelliella pentastirinorum TaxID=472834 RepID=A0AAX3NAW1_9ENTR|nr:dihydrofolate reductase [Candidatus Purcelliella pentastirinorum]WDI78651.1 dihydrofolate reductase [Candidatus Purcelliella pentastirinorum]WDR80322.1 dihydrofolate reductase [Candidatus Purcelliella pentastirinorum]
MISMIVAFSINKVIGINNQIPWYIPEDLKWFKKHTLFKIILMGRLTWESIGKLLTKRTNIVLSRSGSCKINLSELYNTNNVIWLSSFEDLFINLSKNDEVVIIGGESIYKQTLKYVDRLYLTHIYKYFYGDTFFPDYNIYNWKSIYKRKCVFNINGKFTYCLEILDRII